MKKTISFPAALLTSLIAVIALTSCEQSTANETSKPAVVKNTTDKQQN